MAKGRVLVIDGDDWVARLLAAGLRDHGFEVSTCLSGADAIVVAQAIDPDCVVCEVVLPEFDGPSVARTLRGSNAPVASVPILFLSNADDVVSRQAAFAAGGDVYLTKPFRVDEIAMQVDALVGMAARLVGHAPAGTGTQAQMDPVPESAIPGGHAIEGNIAQMSVSTVLTLLEMERRSGLLKVSAGGRQCTLEIVGGYAIRGEIDGSDVAPLAVLREILRWTAGRFRFRPGTEGVVPSNRRSIGALLIESVRLDDESAQAMEGPGVEECPTSRRSWPMVPAVAVPVPVPVPVKRPPAPPVTRGASCPPPPPPARAPKPPPARAPHKPLPARIPNPGPAASAPPAGAPVTSAPTEGGVAGSSIARRAPRAVPPPPPPLSTRKK